MMNDIDWTGVIFGMGVLILGTVVLIVVLIVAERFYRARAQHQDLTRFTKLVEQYEQTAADSTEHQRAATADLAEVRTRLESIERLLREVE
jgi:hypothetical protein